MSVFFTFGTNPYIHYCNYEFFFMEFYSRKDSDLVFNFGPSIMDKCNTLILTFFMSNIDCVNDGNTLVDIRSEELNGKA